MSRLDSGLRPFPPLDPAVSRVPVRRLARDNAPPGAVLRFDGGEWAPAPMSSAQLPANYIASLGTAGTIDAVLKISVNGTGASVSGGTTGSVPSADLLDVSAPWGMCQSGTTSTGWAMVSIGNHTGGLDGNMFRPTASHYLVFETWAACNVLPVSGADHHWFFGFTQDQKLGANTFGVVFQVSAADANWTCITAVSGGGTTTTVTGVPVAVSTAYRLRIEWFTNRALFYINNNLVATHWTNIVTGRCFASYGIKPLSGTTNRSIYWSDLRFWRQPL